MNDQNTQSTRYYVTLQGANYLAMDSKTGKAVFTSNEVPDKATSEQSVAIGEQAEKFLDTLYPKWRDPKAYW